MELRFQNGRGSFDFKIELRFWNGASISKWNFDFKIELRFRNRASVSKWKMELRFQNRASILKWSFDFKMELRFLNGASISKWSFDFEMELQFQLKGFSRDLLYRKKARDFSTRVLALVYSPVFIVAES